GETWNGAPERPGIMCEHWLPLAQIGGEYGSKPSLLMLIAKTGRPWESMVGSGQFGTPCERMHRAKFRSSFSTCCTRAGEQSLAIMHSEIESELIAPPWFGSMCWQARWAACSWELL